MATIWYVLVGFWRLACTRIAWRCFPQAVKTAWASNLAHCPSNPGRLGIRGYAALAWIVTSFWREEEAVCLVEKFQGAEQDDWYWGWVGSQHGIDREKGELEPLTQVDYYTCVWTPAGVIPLPWVQQWFNHTTEKNIWRVSDEADTSPRRRSERSQFKD